MKKLIIIAAIAMSCAAYCADQAEAGATEQKAPEAPSVQQEAPSQPSTDNLQPATKMKDDGTCWAVTSAGKRCSRRKVGESDYCKQHSPDNKPGKNVKQCRAFTFEGKQCSRKPVEGSRYCPQHGGK